MKKILVPTDFSPQASIAVDAAIKIAKITGSSILLYHCSSEPDPRLKKSAYKVNEEYTGNKSAIMMQEVEKKCSAQKVSCESLINSGHFIDNIDSLVAREKFDLIVMGSHGASGKQEYFIGSNTQKVIRKVHANLLILKEPLPQINFETVLFATNLGISDQEAFANFLSFIRQFNLKKIHLLTIDTPGWFTQPRILIEERQQEFKEMADAYEVETHFLRNFTVETGIRKFSEQLNVDLIVISNYERHLLKRIFSGSNVEMLANHSDLPVLSLDRKS